MKFKTFLAPDSEPKPPLSQKRRVSTYLFTQAKKRNEKDITGPNRKERKFARHRCLTALHLTWLWSKKNCPTPPNWINFHISPGGERVVLSTLLLEINLRRDKSTRKYDRPRVPEKKKQREQKESRPTAIALYESNISEIGWAQRKLLHYCKYVVVM